MVLETIYVGKKQFFQIISRLNQFKFWATLKSSLETHYGIVYLAVLHI